MLRIWNHFWNLLLAKLKECDQFDDVCLKLPAETLQAIVKMSKLIPVKMPKC